jgi:tetratricopeptide (TPR) repeat protein
VTLAAGAQDTVDFRGADGKKQSVKGAIKAEDKSEVSITVGGAERKIPVWEIELIRYEKQPIELINANAKLNQQRWDEAIEDYKLIGQNVSRPELQATIGFQIFRASAELALADATRIDEALKWYDRLNATFPDSRHYFPSHELAGRLYLAKGDVAKAATAFALLKKAEGPGAKERAAVCEGIVALRQEKLTDAKIAFDGVLRSTEDSRQARDARAVAGAYSGELLVKSKKFANAEKLLAKLIPEIPENLIEVRAMACNALGDALRGANKPADAIFDGYMKVVAVYDRNPEQLARALFNLVELFPQIDRKDYAERMAARLREEFPNSSWTKKLPAAPAGQ